MNDKTRAAMQQALDAIEWGSIDADADRALRKQAITALREALSEQSEQEPVAYMFKVKRTLPSSTPLDVFAAIEYHPLPHEDIISKEPLYAAPVRTKDLTDEEIEWLVVDTLETWNSKDTMKDFARAVIAKYKEKNK